MHRDMTPTVRLVSWPAIPDGQRMLIGAVLTYIRGVRGAGRRSPINQRQIGRWFRGAPAPMVDFALAILRERGAIRWERSGGQRGYLAERRRYAVRHIYPDGSVLDTDRFEDRAGAETAFEALIPVLHPGETAVLIERGEVLDRYWSDPGF